MKEVRLKDHRATCEWEITEEVHEVFIEVDIDQDGRISSILHELCHVVFNEDEVDQLMDKDMEEITVEAWTLALYRYIIRDRRRLKWWRTAITEKLND